MYEFFLGMREDFKENPVTCVLSILAFFGIFCIVLGLVLCYFFDLTLEQVFAILFHVAQVLPNVSFLLYNIVIGVREGFTRKRIIWTAAFGVLALVAVLRWVL